MKFVTRNKVFAYAKKVMEEFVVINVALATITIPTVSNVIARPLEVYQLYAM